MGIKELSLELAAVSLIADEAKNGFHALFVEMKTKAGVVSVKQSAVGLRQEGNDWIGKAKILETPMGNIAKNLIEGGASITVGLNSVNSPSAAWIGAIGSVNASSYTVGPYVIGTALAKLNSVSANLVYENNVSYWRWTLVFEYRPNGWTHVVNDMGMFKLVAGVRSPIDYNGVNVTVPVNLDGAGLPLAPASSPIPLTFDIYPRVTFPAL